MKVLHIESGKHLYGGAQQVSFLLQHLSKHNVNSVLVCDDRSAIRQKCEDFGIKTRCIRIRGDLDFSFPVKLKKIYKEETPDIIHIHSRKGADIWGGMIANHLKIPVILSRRVDNPEPKWWVKWKYSMYDCVITISDGIRKVLIKEGLPEDKVTLVRSVVDFESFPKAIKKADFQERFQTNDNELIVGCAAQLIERKGQQFLIEALPEVIKHIPNIKVILFGKGKAESRLKALVSKYGLEKTVLFAGFVDDIKSIYPHLDVLVHPALMEGLGVALIEASYCKLPVIAGAAGGIPEIIVDGKSGFLVQPGNVKEIEENLISLLKNRKLRQEMGEYAHKYAIREFAVESMITGNYKVYRKVLNR